jgi:alpha-amylase
MGVALTGWGRFFDHDGNRVTVPAPPTESSSMWLFDLLSSKARMLREVGFTAIQLPPVSKAQGGAAPGCDGYGVMDPRDLGSKPQEGSTPTRYGDRAALLRFIAVAHACDLDVYLDIVLHQRSGENGGAGVFRYLGADGRTLDGRGETTAGWFRGVPPDNLPDDDVPSVFFDFAFGRELSYQHCRPPRVTVEDALDYGDWLLRTTGADGGRLDDVKGIWPPFVREFATHGAMADKFFYSEFFDGNPATLNAWAIQPPLSGRSLVEDFTYHWAVQAACNGYSARPLSQAGYARWRPDLACTFIDNPDTDTSPGQQVISNKLLAYAHMLTSEGYPFVYGKDYFDGSVWPGAYGLKPWIDNLVWIHEHLAAGTTAERFLDDKVIVTNRLGGPGLLTAINFDVMDARTVTCDTAFGPNVPLHDYTGRHGDIWTDSGGRATFTIPSNAFSGGQSYLCFSRTGQGGLSPIRGRSTTQTIFGAFDLDVAQAFNDDAVIGRIEIARGTKLSVGIKCRREGLPPKATVRLTVVNPSGQAILVQDCLAELTQTDVGIEIAGEHSLHVSGEALPATGCPIEVELTYFGLQNS